MDKTMIIGNVGQDAEFSYTPSGIGVAKFSVAVTKRWNSGDEKREKTTWYRVTMWRGLAESLHPYITKGTKVYVEGSVEVSAYINKNGEAAASLELTADKIELLGSKRDAVEDEEAEPEQKPAPKPQQPRQPQPPASKQQQPKPNGKQKQPWDMPEDAPDVSGIQF